MSSSDVPERAVGSIVIALEWSCLRQEVDALSGRATVALEGYGLDEHDGAALELGLRIAEQWQLPVTAVTVGPAPSEAALTEAAARGVSNLVRVEQPADAPRDVVAAELARCCPSDALVVCGCGDVDTGAVGAYLAAELSCPVALGLVALEPRGTGVLAATRRLDRGGVELLHIAGPAVVSVESGAARLRRASLPGALQAAAKTVTVLSAGHRPDPYRTTVSSVRAHRPRPRLAAVPPRGDAVQRLHDLTGALAERHPPSVLHLDPAAAAAALIEQLRRWGYLA